MGIWQEDGINFCSGVSDHCLCSRRDRRAKIYCQADAATQGYSALSVAEVMLRRLGATFQGMSPARERGRLYECPVDVAPSASDTIRRIELIPITLPDIERRKSTPTIVVDSLCGNTSIYHITRIAGRAIPPIRFHTSRAYFRSYEVIQKIWEMLETDRLGADPTLRKIKVAQTERKRQRLEVERIRFHYLTDIAPYAADVVHRLLLQSSSILQGFSYVQHSKRLVLDFNDARVIGLLNDLSQGTSQQYYIDAFDSHNSGQANEHGLEYWTPSDAHVPIDVDTLESKYRQVLQFISSGWQPAHLRDDPHILHKKSEEEYALFVKHLPSFPGLVATFLRFAADGLGISTYISCDNEWTNDLFGDVNMPIYLWIRKSNEDEVKAKLQFSFEPQSPLL